MSTEKSIVLSGVGVGDSDNIALLNSQKEAIKTKLGKVLEGKRYNYIVEDSNLKETKVVLAELNTMKADIKSFAKAKVDAESESINEFKEFFSGLHDDINAKRDELDGSVRVFTDRAKNLHKDALTDALKKAYEDNEVREKFQSFTMLDGMLSTATFAKADGTLIKKWSDAIDAIVKDAQGKQALEDLEILKEQKKIDDEVARQLEIVRKKEKEDEEERIEKKVERALEKHNTESQSTDDSAVFEPNQETVYEHQSAQPSYGSAGASFQGADTTPEQFSQPSEPVPTMGEQSTYYVTIEYSFPNKKGIEPYKIEARIRKALFEARFVHELTINVEEK